MRRMFLLPSLAVVVLAGALPGAVLGATSGPPVCTNASVTCEIGQTADGSNWKIEVPSHWNGTLLLYSHGYQPPVAPNPPADDVVDRNTGDYLLSKGFALAGSSYANNGWAVSDAFTSQTALLDQFNRDFHHPKTTIAWGTSMGGMITAGLLQKFPGRFDGGFSMCGLLAGGVGLWNTNLDLQVAFKTLMMLDPNPAVSGAASQLQITNITDMNANIGAAETALAIAQGTPEGRARIALAAAMIDLPGWFDASPEPAPTDYVGQEFNQYQALQTQLAFVFGFRQDLEGRAGGNPTWNVGVDYATQLARSADAVEVKALYAATSLNLKADVAAINAAPRIDEDRSAARYMEKNIVFNGNLHKPLLTMHTTSDWLVPYQQENAFASAVDEANKSYLLRQVFIHRAGHCTFTDAEMISGLNVLLARVRTDHWSSINPTGLNSAATALGPALNVLNNSSTATPSAFIAAAPGRFLRPYALPPGGHSRLP